MPSLEQHPADDLALLRRAILRFSDLVTVEVLRQGKNTVFTSVRMTGEDGVLAEAIISAVDVPAFPRAAMDGWAYAIAIHPSDDSLIVGGVDGQLRKIDRVAK